MPLFDFVCTACDKNFEAIAKHSERLTLCPHCHSPRTKRLPSFSIANVTNRDESGSEPTPGSPKDACHDHHKVSPRPESCASSYVTELIAKNRR